MMNNRALVMLLLWHFWSCYFLRATLDFCNVHQGKPVNVCLSLNRRHGSQDTISASEVNTFQHGPLVLY